MNSLHTLNDAMRHGRTDVSITWLRRLVRGSMAWCPALIVVFTAGCGGSGLDPILGTPVTAVVDTTRPTVTITVPADGAAGVATNAAITATFSEDMSQATISATTFTLTNTTLATAVAGVVTYSVASRTATFTPSAPLPPNDLFTGTITTGAADLAGNQLAGNMAVAPNAGNHVWTFTTGAGADTTRPTVTITVPANAASGIAPNTAINATFSEDMSPATIAGTSVTLTNTTLGTAVAGVVTYSVASRTAIFTPSAALAASTLFTGTITTAATDLAGNQLAGNTAVGANAGNHVWTFTTAAALDTTRPTVTLTIPASGAAGVAPNTAINATFSEDMNPATIAGTSVTLTNTTLGTAVAGVVTYSVASRTAIFTPSAALAASTLFTGTITTAATDLAGNQLAGNTAVGANAGNHVWTFTTAAALDTTRPTVTLTIPASGAAGVAPNTAINATFSEDMNPATIAGTSVTLTNTTLGTAVAGVVTYSVASRTAIFTPSAALAASTLFTGTITTAATDLAGNQLAGNTAVGANAGNHVWTFTTAAALDTTRPTVTLTIPASGAAGVAPNTAINATFSEDMNPATIAGTSVTLTNTTLGTAVAGVVTYSVASRTAIFTPSAALAASTLFTGTITTAATDLAGNQLAGNTAVGANAGNHVWTFTTSALADTTPPTVTTISPIDGAVGVCLTHAVSATFSEPMNATTINTTTFRVTDSGVAVAGTVTYDAPTQVASFVPSAVAGFAPSRAFVVTVVSGVAGVKDLAGNALAVDRSWGFTTGTQACLTPVNLGTAASFGGFGGGAGITNQGINTIVGGNLGTTAACTLVTGFHDPTDVYSQTPLNVGVVNGSINCAPPAPGTLATAAIATQALADATTAYAALAALPPGSDPGAGQLGGLVLTSAVYTAAGGTFAITSGDLTLDAQGDANAVWVFQSAAALTMGLSATPRRIILVNGAQARNVFWQVGSAARIEDGSTMVGTIIAPAGVTISTAGQTVQTTLIGRALGLTASVTMVNTTIVAP